MVEMIIVLMVVAIIIMLVFGITTPMRQLAETATELRDTTVATTSDIASSGVAGRIASDGVSNPIPNIGELLLYFWENHWILIVAPITIFVLFKVLAVLGRVLISESPGHSKTFGIDKRSEIHEYDTDVGTPQQEEHPYVDDILKMINECNQVKGVVTKSHKELLSSLTKLADTARQSLTLDASVDEHTHARQIFTLHLDQINKAIGTYVSLYHTSKGHAEVLGDNTRSVVNEMVDGLNSYMDDVAKSHAMNAERGLEVVKSMLSRK